MSRRRRGNPLLTRILVISIAAHAVALPIAAHFGAFERIRREFGTSRVVMVSLPPVEREKPKAAAKSEKKTPTAKKAASAAPRASTAQRAGLPQPKVVAATGPADGAGGGPTVDPNASGTAGTLPPGLPGGGSAPKPAAPTGPPDAPPNSEPDPPSASPKTPEPTAPEPKGHEPKGPESAASKPRRIVEAEAIESPMPTIPDELRVEPFEKTLVVEADVDTGGHPTNVRVAQSTGVKALDGAGLDAARRYRFRPATVDDAPVEQRVRFRIVFRVE